MGKLLGLWIGMQLCASGQTLTFSDADAAPAVLEAVEAQAEMTSRIGRTTFLFTFRNPNDRSLDGRFALPLIEGQRVIAWAAEVSPGLLRPAVPIFHPLARTILEDGDTTRRNQQTDASDHATRFETPLPAIPGRGTKQVRVTIDEEVTPVRDHFAHRVRFDYPGALKTFRVSLNVHSTSTLVPQVQTNLNLALPPWRDGQYMTVERMDFEARGFIEIKVPKPERPLVLTGRDRGEEHFYAEIPVVPLLFVRPAPKVTGLIWDSSLSGAKRDHARELALLDAWFREIKQTEVRLFRIQERTSRRETFSVKDGEWKELRAALEGTVYDGASSLDGLADDPKVETWILFSDGHLNLGENAALAANKLKAAIHTVEAAKGSDSRLLQHLASHSGGEYINLFKLDAQAATFALQSQSMRLLAVEFDADSMAEVYPSSGAVVQGETLAVAGELKKTSTQLRLLIGHSRENAMTIDLPILSGEKLSSLATQRWAESRAEALLRRGKMQKAELSKTIEQYGVLVPGGTLELLHSAEEYAIHRLVPPDELRQEWDAYNQSIAISPATREAHLEAVVRAFEDRASWWSRTFPTDKPRRVDLETSALPHTATDLIRESPAVGSPSRRRSGLSLRRMAPESEDEHLIGRTIRLRRWSAEDDVFHRLRALKPDRRYAQYLSERGAHANDPAFFLGASDAFFETEDHQLGLRILSNVIESGWDDPALLRMVGHRLMQWEKPELAVDVFEKLIHLRGNEPQSKRDLALACWAAGDGQRAVDLLWEIASQPWDSRFPAVELIALSELNALIARAEKPLDLSRFDPRLLRNLPLDLRVVLTWDAEDTDLDLWIDDPNGQTGRYDLPLTYQGGATSHDFTGGYGPEEFILKRAVPGKYSARINYLGDRRQSPFGPVTAQLRVITGFGTPAQQEKRWFLRLKEKQEVISAATFELGGRRK